MAVITREYLENSIDNMRRQIAAYNGAIEYAEHLLGILDTNAGLPIEQLAEMVAGAGATATIEPIQ
jgi:hypothetical protein